MHIDLETRDLPSTFRSDVCVIGGGIAGILLASRLGQNGIRVNLLEAGGLEFEERSQNFYRTEMFGQHHCGAFEGRFRTFGGSSTRWGGQLLPYTDDVLHPDSRLGLPSWPIDLSELEKYYEDVQEVMGVAPLPFSDDLLQEFGCETPFQSSRVRLRFSKCSPFVRRNLSKTLGRECLTSKEVTIFTHANALSIDTNPGGDAALAVTASNYQGVKYTFTADRFAICTGTIEASRLLLASTQVCSKGVGNDYGQVGRYFHDHVGVQAAVIAPEDCKRVVRAFAPYVKGGTSYRAKLEATSELRVEKGLLSVAAQLSVEEPPGSGADLVRKILQGIQEGHLHVNFCRDIGNIPAAIAEGVNFVLAAKLNHRRYVTKRSKVVLDMDVEQRPNPESRIRLAEEKDALGMRKAVLDWKISIEERECLRKYAAEIDLLFRERGFAKINWSPQITAEDDSWEQGRRLDGFHMMGGTRMGTNPASSVVDGSLKVHGLKNLYIASCSVFPTGGSSNPTFTMMALALRLADKLLANEKKSPCIRIARNINGGAERDRTADLLVANEALSQLSYSPTPQIHSMR